MEDLSQKLPRILASFGEETILWFRSVQEEDLTRIFRYYWRVLAKSHWSGVEA